MCEWVFANHIEVEPNTIYKAIKQGSHETRSPTHEHYVHVDKEKGDRYDIDCFQQMKPIAVALCNIDEVAECDVVEEENHLIPSIFGI